MCFWKASKKSGLTGTVPIIVILSGEIYTIEVMGQVMI